MLKTFWFRETCKTFSCPTTYKRHQQYTWKTRPSSTP